MKKQQTKLTKYEDADQECLEKIKELVFKMMDLMKEVMRDERPNVVLNAAGLLASEMPIGPMRRLIIGCNKTGSALPRFAMWT